MINERIASFWEYVQIGEADECWPWIGKLNGKYGYFFVSNHHTRVAHRWAWELTNGRIAPNASIRRKCKTSTCCNPAHMYSDDDRVASFMARVDIRGRDECWNWKSHINSRGYGSFFFDGTMESVHRISWEVHNGPIPPGKGTLGTCVCHKCDNPICCNPNHLFLGSQADNVADRDKKGRNVVPDIKGEQSANAKLTDAQILEIRSLRGISQRKIATIYGVSQSLISDIVNRKRWKHI